MSAETDYRVPKIKAWRLQAESLRLGAESDRLFAKAHGMGNAGFIAQVELIAKTTEQQAENYDLMAAQLEAEMASGPL